MSLPSETQVDDAIKAGAYGLGSGVAILGHIFDWFPTEVVQNLIDVATASVLGAVSAFYLGRKLYRMYKGKTDTTTTTTTTTAA